MFEYVGFATELTERQTWACYVATQVRRLNMAMSILEIPLKEIPIAIVFGLVFGIFLKVHNATDLDGWLSCDPQIVLNG